MAIKTPTQVTITIEAHLVSKLEDYAPNATNLSQAVLQVLDEFFTLKSKQGQTVAPKS
jgi:hypothetical protein